MSARPPAIWTTGTTEGFHTGTWRSAMPVYLNRPSPCHRACPVDGDIAVWIGQFGAGDPLAAWTTLVRNNPFPAVTGRVCHHPCEAACNRGEYDQAVAICALERRIGDQGLEAGWRLPPAADPRHGSVAVVGGGPAGLAAACHLRWAGYAVSIFEAQSQLGGLLRYGIPPYRLPRAVLDGEIARILDLGVEVHATRAIDGWSGVERLRAEFDAVYLALGAGCAKRVPQLDYTQSWVLDGARYLAAASGGHHPEVGARVVVVGGGSAAVDAARTARRHGAEVSILALESEAQMPAQREEVVEAVEEGVELVAGAMLQVAEAAATGVELRCVKVHFEAGAARGEFRVEALPGSEFTLIADTVISSIGQDPDLGGAPPGAVLDGALVRIDDQLRTPIDGVFAGGDVASMERFVTAAFGHGKRAAASIQRYLQGDESAGVAAADIATSGFDAVNTHYHPRAPRQRQRATPAAERIGDFDEVQRGLPAPAARAEAARCFSCGTCTLCDNCFHFCPDMAVRRDHDGYAIDALYCKGCGLCVQECPTGAVTMREELR